MLHFRPVMSFVDQNDLKLKYSNKAAITEVKSSVILQLVEITKFFFEQWDDAIVFKTKLTLVKFATDAPSNHIAILYPSFVIHVID